MNEGIKSLQHFSPSLAKNLNQISTYRMFIDFLMGIFRRLNIRCFEARILKFESSSLTERYLKGDVEKGERV